MAAAAAPARSPGTTETTRLGLLALLVLAGCTPRLHGQLFHKREVDYRIGHLDEGWQPRRMRGMDLLFHKAGQGSIGVHATCRGYEDVPAAALLGHLLFGTTQRSYLLDEDVTLDGRGARHTKLDAELDGVPVRLDIYVLTRSACVFDLSYVSDRKARGHDDFVRFVREFRVEAVNDG